MKKNMLVAVFFSLFLYVLLTVLSDWLYTPIVHWSYSKDECVKVIKNGVEYSCSEIPDKYERVWVK